MAEFFKPYTGVKRPVSGKRERLLVSGVTTFTVATYTILATGRAAAESGGGGFQDARRPVYALVQVVDQPINFTLDGTAPTTTLGYLAVATDHIHLNSFQEIQNFKAIKNGVTDANLEVTYFYGR